MDDILLNITIGSLIAIIIYKLIVPSVIYKAPDSNVIKTQIIKDNNKYYILTPVIHICPPNSKHS